MDLLRILVVAIVGLAGGVAAVGVARRHVESGDVPAGPWIAACVGGCALVGAAVDDLRLVVIVWMVVAATALSAVDAATSRLPNAILYPSGFVGAGLVVVVSVLRGRPEEIAGAAIGLVAGVVPLYLVWLTARSGGLGFGDVRFAGWLGMHLGVLQALRIVAGLLLGLIAGLVVTVLLAAMRRRSVRQPFPLGPYLALGAVLSVPWGSGLIGG